MTYVITKDRRVALDVEHVTRFSIQKTVSYGSTGMGASHDVYQLRAHQDGPQMPFILEVYPDEGQAAAALSAMVTAVHYPKISGPQIIAPQPSVPE
jgi:hypothetical protein